MYLLMGRTAKFALELSTSSGIVLKEYVEHHESISPLNLEICLVFAKLLTFPLRGSTQIKWT